MMLLLWCALAALNAFGQTNLNGAGATFPYPIYSKWFSEYNKMHPNVQINYQSIGSGGGIRQLTAQTVFFGATDGPMTQEQLVAAAGKVLHLPMVLGGVVSVNNNPGVNSELKFTGGTFHVRGEVVWAREGPVQFLSSGRVGMGITFLQPPADLLSFLERMGSPA